MRPSFALCAALFLMLLAPAFARAQETPTIVPTPTLASVSPPDAVDILARAQEVADDADRAINNVATMLNFLEVAGLVLGGLVAAAAIFGLRSTQTLRAELKADLDEANKRFEKMLAESQMRLLAFEREAESELDKIRHYAGAATENLSAVQQRVENAVNALTLVQLGKLQIENRNWNAALRTLEAAHEADPTNRAANYYLGELYIIRRDLDRAIDLLKRAQPDGEVFPPAEAALAYALRLHGETLSNQDDRNRYYAEAEQRYLRALDIESGARDIHDASVWAGLGALYRRQRRYDDAFRCYDKAEKVTPYSTYPLINLAILHLRRGELEQARKHFRTVVMISERRLETNPMDEWTRYDAITGNLGLDQGERARAHLDYILSAKPNKGPMESFISGLAFMAEAEAAPAVVAEVLALVRERLKQLVDAEAADDANSG
jgi:tetratricopeptide (TPR) repeat protein